MIDHGIISHLLPSKHLMDVYFEIKNNLIKTKPYNFIHYRYEIDFKQHFQIQIESIDEVLVKIKFKNNELPIYVAASNINKLLDLNNDKYKNVLCKDDDKLSHLIFEERAFIDYMIFVKSVECYGHNNSSFSGTLNGLKRTNNYYNLL